MWYVRYILYDILSYNIHTIDTYIYIAPYLRCLEYRKHPRSCEKDDWKLVCDMSPTCHMHYIGIKVLWKCHCYALHRDIQYYTSMSLIWCPNNTTSPAELSYIWSPVGHGLGQNQPEPARCHGLGSGLDCEPEPHWASLELWLWAKPSHNITSLAIHLSSQLKRSPPQTWWSWWIYGELLMAGGQAYSLICELYIHSLQALF